MCVLLGAPAFLSAQGLKPPPQDFVLHFQANAAASTDQISLGPAFTMESWVYLDAASPTMMIMGKANNPRGTDPFFHYMLGLDSTGRRPRFTQSTGQPGSSRSLNGPSDLPLNSWMHMAAVLDAGVMRLYVNGQLVASGSSPGAPAGESVPFGLGGAIQAGASLCCSLSGALREARVWSRALSAADLQTNAIRTLAGNEAGLLADWPLSEGSGLTVHGIGPQAVTLIIQGSAAWGRTKLLDDGPYWETQDLPLVTDTNYGVHPVVFANTDHRLDILLAYAQLAKDKPAAGPVLFLHNQGNRIFTPVKPAQPAMMVFPRNHTLADFDGDGYEDVVVADTGFDTPPFPGGVTRIFIQTAGEMKDETDSRLPPLVAYTHDVCSGDINRDGRPDLFFASMVLNLNDGNGHFRNANELLPASFTSGARRRPISCQFADVNRDGAADLLFGFNGDIEPQARDGLLLNDGQGNLRDVTDQFMPLKRGGATWVTHGFAVADVNRDGWPDLIASIAESGSIAQSGAEGGAKTTMQLLINNHDGTFHDQDDAGLNVVRTEGNYDKIFAVDLNRDGWLDLLVNQAGYGVRLYQNMGGHFEDRTETLGAGLSAGLAGDFDGDGRIDIALFNQNKTKIAWAKNLWPAVCHFAVSIGGWAFSGQGGSGSVDLVTTPDCSWNVSGLPGWLIITSASSGMGSATIAFEASANAGTAFADTLTIGGVSFTIEQAAGMIAGLTAVGSLAQVAAQGVWKFTLDAVNLGASPATVRFSFLDNSGATLPIPLAFPQAIPAADSLVGPVLDRTIKANAQLVVESSGSEIAPPLVGWGQIAATGKINGYGIFSNPAAHWNAVVPLETRSASSYILAFDNTGVLATGVAVANVAAIAASIPVIIRDDTGAQIGTASINLAAQGHDSFMLDLKYLITSGKRGTIEFDTPAGGQISVLGLRANGPALTTLPVLANMASAGGSITHATYNGGFTSTFYMVNTGTAPANFTLSFFDEAGNPLTVPLWLPQFVTPVTTPALTRTLAPGALLVIETVTQEALPSVLGSAQLTATGNISGFEIFRWTPFGQEASVPLETRTPGSFVLVFDNTNGLTTGVALANVTAAAANISVIIRDDNGILLQTTSITLLGRGHKSFLLPINYPAVAGKRGMVEFVVPQSGQISAVGLRAKSDGTLTTIPILTR